VVPVNQVVEHQVIDVALMAGDEDEVAPLSRLPDLFKPGFIKNDVFEQALPHPTQQSVKEIQVKDAEIRGNFPKITLGGILDLIDLFLFRLRQVLHETAQSGIGQGELQEFLPGLDHRAGDDPSLEIDALDQLPADLLGHWGERARLGDRGQNLLQVEGFAHLHHRLLGLEEAQHQLPEPAGVFAVSEQHGEDALVFPARVLFVDNHLGDQEDGEIKSRLNFQEMADGVFPGLEKTLAETHLVHQKHQGAAFFPEHPVEIAVLKGIGPGAAPGEIVQGGGDDLDQVGKRLPHPEVEIEGHFRGHYS